MEIWKDVVGLEGKYQVSNLGRVKTLPRRSGWGIGYTTKEKILSTQLFPCGYLYVGLTIDGKCKSTRIHRLVAKAFVPNPENKPVVNHINGIKTDNRAENLEWCTISENTAHAYSSGVFTPQTKKVSQLNLAGEEIRVWNNTREITKELKLSQQNISACCLGKRKTAGGYIWRYKEAE